MARGLNRGEIWTFEFARPDKRRPVVIISRDDAIPLLTTVLVAPVRSTIHGAPSEVVIGTDEGLKHASAVSLDHIQAIDKARLSRFVGSLSAGKMREVCRALAIATGCDAG